MLKFISRNIFTGLLTILPIVLTLYVLGWTIVTTESMLGGVIRTIVPDSLYKPGIGVVFALALAFIIGLMMRMYVVRSLFNKGEQLLYHMPVIKSVYKTIRDFFQYLAPSAQKEIEQVVSVSIGNTGMKVIGFITQTNPARLPEGFGSDDTVLVYLPLSYMIGGYAVVVPRSAVTPLRMSMEEAMRFTLTAGVTGTTAAAPIKKGSDS